MRLTVLLAPTLLGFVSMLPGCAYVGNPLDGFGGFIRDTHSFDRGPNSPPGDGPNMRRVSGRVFEAEPLTPEPGNVWPGATPPDPTLSDLEKQQNDPSSRVGNNALPGPSTSDGRPQRPITRGSSTPPGSVEPSLPPAPSFRAATPNVPSQSPPPIRAIPTPQGPGFINPGSSGVQTYTAPGGGIGIIVPNGNGTNTLIGPDGGVTTAPQQR